VTQPWSSTGFSDRQAPANTELEQLKRSGSPALLCTVCSGSQQRQGKWLVELLLVCGTCCASSTFNDMKNLMEMQILGKDCL